MTPEEEAALVPDWVEVINGDWYDASEVGVVKRWVWLGSLGGLCVDTEAENQAMDREGAQILSKALQFFAEHGRLPKREG